MNKYRILLGTIFLVLLSLGGFYLGRQYQNSSKCTTCTEEAKLCPDGSYVSRTGPNCEFTTCPAQQPYSTIGETANWKIYTNEKYSFSFSYPNSWYASYEICPHRENASYLVVFFTMIIPCEGPEADLFSDESPAKILDITTQAKFDLNKEFQKASEQDLKPEIIGLDGTTALKFTLLRPEIHGVTSIGVSFNRFEKGVVLYFTPKRNDVEVLDQILSTFKFVD